jgi:hypothetical protein
MATLGLYTDALIKAEKVSVEIESAVAVIHWRLLRKFDVVLLDSYTATLADYPLVHLMATVDHKGIITESGHAKAVKEAA